MDENQVQEEQVTEKTEEEKEYEAGFKEATKPDSEQGLPSEEKAPETEPAPVKKEEPAPTPKKEEEPGAILEKRLKDTQAHATKVSQENAELKRKLEAFERGNATQAEVDAAKKAVKDATDNLDEAREKVYQDYPELKGILEPIVEANRNLAREVGELKTVKAKDAENERRQTALDHFNKNVKPEVLKTHQDFDSVVKDPDYWTWAEAQSPALRTAAMDSPDPKDITWAVTEFKKYKASDEAKALSEKDEKTKQTKLLNAMSIRGGGGAPVTGGKRGDPNDYDAGFAQGAKTG